ncbi:MAG: (d)CMP kinase [Acidimicrobiales bacterium]
MTVSGLPGSGTSTLSARAAAALGLEHLDGGTVFRSMASELGVSIAEFSREAEHDATHDLELDTRLAARARLGNVLLESRLAGWITRNEGIGAWRVWVDCDERERAQRVASRERTELGTALAQNRAREASERARYLGYYAIDLADLSIYDLVLDSTSATPDELVAAITGPGTT